MLLGMGDVTFATPVAYEVNQIEAISSGLAPALAAGDFSGTGNLDIALSVYTYMFLFHGNGDGTLVQEPGQIPVAQAVSVTTGDVTNQGKPDLLLGDDAYEGGSFTSSVWVLLNQ